MKVIKMSLPFFLIFLISLQSSLSSPSVEELGHHAGYYNLPQSQSARIFYFFFESRNNKTDPVVIWLSGGPGCSSSFGLFYENGPFKISEDLTLYSNDYGWDKVSNIIYVDQPVGTGFSYTSDSSDLRHDEDGVSNDLYDFLQAFFKERPMFAKNDFYITGESYAGHYSPALASRIHSANKKKEGIPINLKGMAIGNGMVNPEIQYGAHGDFALQMKLITESDLEAVKQDYVGCQSAIKKCNLDGGLACDSAWSVCEKMFLKMMLKNVGMDAYDLRKKCMGECPDVSRMEAFLNQEDVKKALKVGDIIFHSCSDEVFRAMKEDVMVNDVKIPDLVDAGIKLLVYAGEFDIICNWLGNARWVEQMNWSGQKDFRSAKTITFVVDGKEAGIMKNHRSLTFLKVHDAGHMVPTDQPNASLQMIKKWMQGSLN